MRIAYKIGGPEIERDEGRVGSVDLDCSVILQIIENKSKQRSKYGMGRVYKCGYCLRACCGQLLALVLRIRHAADTVSRGSLTQQHVLGHLRSAARRGGHEMRHGLTWISGFRKNMNFIFKPSNPSEN